MSNTPNPAANLTLGKGILYFAKKDPSTGLYDGFRDLGNAPEVSANITPDKLAHYNSRGGLKVKDLEIVKELALKFSFSLDEPNAENLAMTFMADSVVVTQQSATAQTLVIDPVTKGRYYNTGKKNITVTSVALTDTPATVYTVTTDYVVDSKYGRVFIPYTSTIAAAADITVTYNVAASTYTQLKSLNQTKVEGELHFISNNPAGENYEMRIWRANLIPTGNLALIGDDWQSISFEAEVLKDELRHADSPYMDINTLIATS